MSSKLACRGCEHEVPESGLKCEQCTASEGLGFMSLKDTFMRMGFMAGAANGARGQEIERLLLSAVHHLAAYSVLRRGHES